ncbi:MAG: chromosome partitioning protein ParA [Alphaproteobacteria bacterium]|nr:chromosome partitioning protein ParA [Alphaproteobacteria bacterium]
MLPELRNNETGLAARLQKLTLERVQLEEEAKRIDASIEENKKLLSQARVDYERDISRQNDGKAAIENLHNERLSLEEMAVKLEEQLPKTRSLLDEVLGKVESLDTELNALVHETAMTEARREALEREALSIEDKKIKEAERLHNLEAQHLGITDEIEKRPDLAMAESLVKATEEEFSKRQEEAHDAEEFYNQADMLLSQAREIVQKTETTVAKLIAERDALEALLSEDRLDDAQKIIDLISVNEGLEKTLAIALGEALNASLDINSSKHWRLPSSEIPKQDLPSIAAPLLNFVEAPSELSLSLSQIGIVGTKEQGLAIINSIKAGQTIVSRDGWAWRWDGWTLTPEAKTEAAARLEQRNRLKSIEKQIQSAQTECSNSKSALEQSLEFFNQRQEQEHKSRETLKLAFSALNDARDVFAKQEKEVTALNSKISIVNEGLLKTKSDISAFDNRLLEIRSELALLPPVADKQEEISNKKTELANLRAKQSEYNNEHLRLVREQEMNALRIKAIDSEVTVWQSQISNADKHITSLSERIKELEIKLQELELRPSKIQETHGVLLNELGEIETLRSTASDALIAKEQELTSIEKELKLQEQSIIKEREHKIRAESDIRSAQERFVSLQTRMQEKLNCSDVSGLADIARDTNEEISVLEQKLSKCLYDRDSIGAVNLCAEQEAHVLEEKIDLLNKEKDDLISAISKLRQGIYKLNSEAHERLQAAFSLVNEHFQNLFKTLFNGGKAYIELTNTEDPMNAGLEIYAAPPGKKMQALSLLSGGERTLTALALLFAVFKTHPSPICVLDEAEASLDESNINKFCDLIEKIADETGARFLIITHQRITMARMNRLFGVTMSEKGVSQLVSVDLENAVAIRDGKKISLESTLENTISEIASDAA